MPEEVDELIIVGNWAKQHGMMHAAFVLGREGANEIRAKRKPRRKMVAVKLATGGKAWIEKGRLSESTERED
jgi:hypothetical protein